MHNTPTAKRRSIPTALSLLDTSGLSSRAKTLLARKNLIANGNASMRQ